ncbi:MAG: hypothetical protein ABIM89_12655 [Mycobacteriales bacterium]
MNRASDSREVLIAELLGDFKTLLDRIEAVAPTLNEAQQGLARTAADLSAKIEPFRKEVLKVALDARDKSVEYIVRRSFDIAGQTVDEQTRAMKESARTIFVDEVTPPLRRLAHDVQQIVDGARRWWVVWLMHAATAITSSACSTLLLVGYLEHREAVGAKTVVSAEPPAHDQPASQPEKARARK